MNLCLYSFYSQQDASSYKHVLKVTSKITFKIASAPLLLRLAELTQSPEFNSVGSAVQLSLCPRTTLKPVFERRMMVDVAAFLQ